MTGTILGGSSVAQAAKLQIIILFMITATTTLASMFITLAAISAVVDNEHRIRSECIHDKKPAVYWMKDWKVGKLSANLSNSFNGWRTSKSRNRGEGDLEENEGLLAGVTEDDDQ